MVNYTISLTEAQEKAISYVSDVQMWIEDAAVGLSNHEKKLILSNLIEYCNDNNIKIATGESAQIEQAFSLGIATSL
tara:strand:- start:288 stop:518 length:231 start_codon:yes stop_codon:yes gene_type:complete